MKPEKLVVSLSTAKKLKEAGFPQETLLKWWQAYLGITKYGLHERSPYLATKKKAGFEKDTLIAAAPTFNEIWERLPDEAQFKNGVYYKKLRPKNDVVYERQNNIIVGATDINIQEAAAQMWLKLKEGGLI